MSKRIWIDNIEEVSKQIIEGVNIVDVVGRYIQLQRYGAHLTGRCPYCGTDIKGTFLVTPQRKMASCFSCNKGGDVINLLAKFERIKYHEAAAILGVEYGIISSLDISSIERNNYKPIKKRKRKEKKEEIKATSEQLNQIYNMFLDLATLEDYHLEALLKNRKLSKDIVMKRKFKTYPSLGIMRDLLREMENQNIPIEVLSLIPGFYKDIKRDRWEFAIGNGLMIPIRNYKQEIVGIQIRKDKENVNERYKYGWFTSSYAKNSKETLAYGCSPGAPLDVIIPEKITNRTVFVTEGKFKAEKIAEKWGSITISIQGVRIWSQVPSTIEKIEKYYGIDFSSVYVVNDSDYRVNEDVYDATKNMMNAIEKEIGKEILFISWDSKYGKGIDDLIIKNKNIMEKLEIISLEDFNEISIKRYMDELKNLNLNHLTEKPQQIMPGTEIDLGKYKNDMVNKMYNNY